MIKSKKAEHPISMRLPVDMVKELDRLADALQTSRGAILRIAIDRGLRVVQKMNEVS